MDYQYDIFLSYRHTTGAKEWVRDTFVPELKQWLANSLPDEPRIFLDSENIRASSDWQVKLSEAIRRSKCLIAILNAPYFSSDYCAAEWFSFIDREEALGYCKPGKPEGLIIPIRFFDGQHYDSSAKRKQYLDMTSWAITAPAFRGSAAYLDFQKAVQRLALELADPSNGQVANPPPYADWPVRFPDEPQHPSAMVSPRIK